MSRSNEGKIAGAASIIGSATVVSRILGYIRDAVVAFVFGAAMQSDAFFVAFRISNLLRRLVGEGALTSSFVPIFTGELNERTKDEARLLASSVFTLFTLILIVLAALGIVFSEEIVRVMSPGFIKDPAKLELTVSLTRLMFPYMVFVGLMAIAMGVLNSVKHFTAPALAPAFFNISIILSVVAVAPFIAEPVYALAFGVLFGGLLQFAVQLPALRRHGFMPAPAFRFRDPGIKKIFTLMGPAAFGVGVYQLNILVTLWFASRLAEGSVSYLYYAGRLMELPLGVFGVAVSTAVLPSLSEHVAKKEWDEFRGAMSFALRIVNFVTIPAMAGLLVLNAPIIEVLFKRGEFGGAAAAGTSVALYYYAVGIVPVSVARILTSVFYSIKDTATPVFIALISFFFNVVMCFALVGPLEHGGLALATSLSALLNAVMLFVVLRYRFGSFGGRVIVASGARALAASIFMGVVIYYTGKLVGAGSLSGLLLAVYVGVATGAGVVAYLLLARVMRSPEVSFLKGFLSKGG